ncbi:hypothetical protein FHS95_003143 [Sphingomonas naasensis]|uniref:Uncharacterized protein n=1 Tax=Sphingomonas naasensis TaxID=1344951 RepID=A0A4S1WIU3_9SPHN|nr:hypothetical protein [Sphingomonas naasensis]NIJ21440.1 hypothetical protein [Sphingomonas naasensis]TGX41600.1 hypothetical protein E5A74_13390 [Sphingomonas naasensis]
MKSLPRAALAALCLLTAAPAQAETFCEAFKPVVESGTAPQPWLKIRGGQIDSLLWKSTAMLPGFAKCQIAPASHDYSCDVTNLTADKVAALEASTKASLEACLGSPMVRDATIVGNPWTWRPEPGAFPLIILYNLRDGISFVFLPRG